MPIDNKVKPRLTKLRHDAAKGGYLLNTDNEIVEALAEGLVANQERYGAESCPCRLYKGSVDDNLDIVCPCVYRDDDLAEYGACYCGLYIASEADAHAQKQVPERRPPLSERKQPPQKIGEISAALKFPVYRCSVCGYLCANNNPPRVCPICKATAQRFAKFM